MNFKLAQSRQPIRELWSLECLMHARSIALRHAIDASTKLTYSLALHSYLNFYKLHYFPVTSTENMLSFFIVYMSAYIEPRPVDSYLFGICHELEEFFLDIRHARSSQLVSQSLKECKCMFSKPINQKCALTSANLSLVHQELGTSDAYHDKLFLAMILVGFHALLRLGKIVDSNNPWLQNPLKLIFHFLHSDGAIALAEQGVHPELIQAAAYIRKHSVLFNTFLFPTSTAL
ncbi:hypothetical protein OBBRIDRAFT_811658 [Obba rivulosa]|uniref:Uncharacterized protein n=1 Tax=Obba rivulosa TaxID=1052685 RepID=A0A8E2AWU4_9APHY|nr:hypothetical protein OBBRIDRAFT_811658 [Obba rivulosa]